MHQFLQIFRQVFICSIGEKCIFPVSRVNTHFRRSKNVFYSFLTSFYCSTHCSVCFNFFSLQVCAGEKKAQDIWKHYTSIKARSGATKSYHTKV